MQTVWTQSGSTKCWASSEFILIDTDAILQKKGNSEKYEQMSDKIMQNYLAR